MSFWELSPLTSAFDITCSLCDVQDTEIWAICLSEHVCATFENGCPITQYQTDKSENQSTVSHKPKISPSHFWALGEVGHSSDPASLNNYACLTCVMIWECSHRACVIGYERNPAETRCVAVLRVSPGNPDTLRVSYIALLLFLITWINISAIIEWR